MKQLLLVTTILLAALTAATSATGAIDPDSYLAGEDLAEGSALTFDGLNDFVSITDASDLEFAHDQDFTLEAWIKTPALQADTTYVDNDIVAKWTAGTGYPYVIRYTNQTASADPGHLYAGRSDGASSPHLMSLEAVGDDRFHHVAFVKAGVTLFLYVDGVLNGTTADTTSGSTTNDSPLTLGKRADNSHWWQGNIDELRIWNVGRSQAEIRAHMYRPLNGAETGLVGYWPLDEGQGETAQDQTAHGHHGSLGGGDAQPGWLARPLHGLYLMAVYNSTDGPQWAHNDGWGGNDPCDPAWYGVGCYDGQVTSLDLTNNQLSGPLPPELGDLSAMDRLYLGDNQLSGPMPPELGNLSNLTFLALGGNELSGPLPPELGNLSNLAFLLLWGNPLTGPLPPELGNMSSMTYLHLNDNQLNGPIPPELGKLSNMGWLNLSRNQLSGPLPAELGKLSNMYFLHLDNNQLSGPIPAELGNLSNLQILSLPGNQLSGPIPPQLGNLSSLNRLELTNNQLSEPIPAELGNLSNLGFLNLDNNQLSGRIPPELSNLGNLAYLYLHDNQLSGRIPPELGQMGNLHQLWLHNNQLSGRIPPELSNLGKLSVLLLAGNPALVCWPTDASRDWALNLGWYDGPQASCRYASLPMVFSAE